MRWWLLTATCVVAAGCSQPLDEPASDLQETEVVEETAEDPDAGEAAAELESATSPEPVDQFDFD